VAKKKPNGATVSVGKGPAKDSKPAMTAIATISREVARDLDSQRLDLMFAGLIAEPIYDEKGRLVSGGAYGGEPQSVSAAVKVLERRAKLLGLDAPTKVKAEVTGSLKDMTDAELLELKKRLGGK
jgi:hypothetical protein